MCVYTHTHVKRIKSVNYIITLFYLNFILDFILADCKLVTNDKTMWEFGDVLIECWLFFQYLGWYRYQATIAVDYDL